jgi:high-affinity iron transporter
LLTLSKAASIFGSLLVTLREGFEAALIVGLVLASLRSTQVGATRRRVWVGVGVATLFSIGVATLLFATGRELDGTAEQLFEGATMLAAVALLTWMIFWMRRQSATAGLRDKVGAALTAGGRALFWLAFVAVAREGIEMALFLFAASGASSATATVIGALLGLAIAIVLGVVVYRGGRRLDLGLFFRVTSLLLLAFSAYLLVGGLREVGELLGNEMIEEAVLPVALVYALTVVWLYVKPPAWLTRQTANS